MQQLGGCREGTAAFIKSAISGVQRPLDARTLRECHSSKFPRRALAPGRSPAALPPLQAPGPAPSAQGARRPPAAGSPAPALALPPRHEPSGSSHLRDETFRELLAPRSRSTESCARAPENRIVEYCLTSLKSDKCAIIKVFSSFMD